MNLAVAPSPDLAIVQGAAHYVTLEQKKPPASGGGPAAPRYNSIISSNSYGILVADSKVCSSHTMLWGVEFMDSMSLPDLKTHGHLEEFSVGQRRRSSGLASCRVSSRFAGVHGLKRQRPHNLR